MSKVPESAMPEEALWVTFFDPLAILNTLGLTRTDADVAEFGCGYGTFTRTVAALTSGTVIALDIEPAMIAATARRLGQASSGNVRLVLRDFVTDGSGLPDASVDYALLFNILHAEDPVALLREAFRILRPAGLVGIIHWNHSLPTPRGPDLRIRPRPEQCRNWVIEAGFTVVTDVVPLPPHHYGLTGQKVD